MINLHYCETSGGMSLTCVCIRGIDHDENLFDVPVGEE